MYSERRNSIDSQKRNEKTLNPETLELAGNAIEKDYVVRYERYPTEHPVSQFAQKALDSVLEESEIGKYSVIVTSGWDSENACALPNGTILVSDRLFALSEGEPRTIEELQFVLRHEMFHVRQEHAAQGDEGRKRRRQSKTISQLMRSEQERIGRDRIHEYEADIRANVSTDSEEHNPYGGIRFMERAAEKEQQRIVNPRGDIGEKISTAKQQRTHGSSINRLLNLHYSARIIDSSTMSADLTPIPVEVMQQVSHTKPRVGILKADPWKTSRDIGAGESQREIALEAATGDEILHIANTVYHKWKTLSSKPWSRSTESARIKLARESDFIKEIISRSYAEITAEVTPFSKSIDRSLYRGLVAEWGYGLAMEETIEDSSLMKPFENFYDHFEEGQDFLDLPDAIRTLETTDVILRYSPEKLLLHFASESCDFGTFDTDDGLIDLQAFFSYCEDLLDATFSLYEKRGVVDLPDKKMLFNKMIAFGFLSVPTSEIHDAVISSYSHPLVNRAAIISELLHSIQFPRETFISIVHDGVPTFEDFQARLEDDPVKNISYLASIGSDIRIRTSIVKKDISSLKKKLPSYEFNIEIKDEDSEAVKDLKTQILTLQELDEKYDTLSEQVNDQIIIEIESGNWKSPEDLVRVLLQSTEYSLGKDRDYIASIIEINHQRIYADTQSYMAGATTPVQKAIVSAYVSRGLDVERDSMVISETINTGIEYQLESPYTSTETYPDTPYTDDAYASGPIRLEDIYLLHKTISGEISIDDTYQFSEVQFDSILNRTYDKVYFLGLLQHIDRCDRAQFFADIEQIAEKKPLFEPNSYSLLFVKHALDTFSFDPTNPKEMEQLITIAAFIPDPDIAARLQQWAIGFLEDSHSSEQLEALLFSDTRTEGKALTEARKNYIDQHIRTPQELDDALKKIMESSALTDRQTQEYFGKAILGNEMFRHMLTNPVQLLIAGMESKRNDRKLRLLVLDRCIDATYGIEDDPKKADDVPSADSLVERMYQFDENTRYMFIRELLVGEYGILKNKKEMLRLVDHLFSDEIMAAQSESEQAVRNGLRHTIETAVSRSDIPTLYFMFAPFIQERSFRRPEEPTPWDEIVSGASILRSIDEDYVDQMRVNLIKRLSQGSESRDSSDWKERCFDYRASISSSANRMTGKEKTVENKQVSSVEFIRHLAGKIGAPGVRLLQVIGQYISMPPELEAEFSQVYDSVPGQNKLSGYYTARREWSSIREEVVEIGLELGGGSLATVWEAITENGEEAIKVLNPNTRFYVDTICDLLEDTFQSMEDAYPRQSRLGVLAIRDIREWLIGDIEYEGFREKDEMFKSANHGFTAEGSDYSIYVPQSYGEDSIYYKREEKIPGLNLTKMDELIARGEDIQAIARTVAKNAIHQIITGVVHSDFHPGNIRIMEDQKVAILDRNFFIELDMSERLFLGRLVSENPETLLMAFSTYLSSLPENAEISNIHDALEKTLKKNEVDLGSPEGIAQVIAASKESEVYVPLKVTLLVKNFLSLNKFCQAAGYSSIKEAIVA